MLLRCLCYFQVGWFANPIYNGDYPAVMKERIAYRSQIEGFERSRLPEFTEEEKRLIRGTSDYFCMQIYDEALVSDIEEPDFDGPPSGQKDKKCTMVISDRPEVHFSFVILVAFTIIFFKKKNFQLNMIKFFGKN